jgi:hypothetical protein
MPCGTSQEGHRRYNRLNQSMFFSVVYNSNALIIVLLAMSEIDDV